MSGQEEALAVAQKTEMVAQYLCKKFHNLRVQGYDTDLLPPMEWSLEYLMEADLAANIQWLKKMSQCLHDLETSDWCDPLT